MMALMLKLRHEADASPAHFQVYTGQVRLGDDLPHPQHGAVLACPDAL
jgi:hypothetical protein